MLSTRMKQINAYGKRGKRVVDVTVTDSKPVGREIVSIFDDLPPAQEWAPVASRMKGRDASTPAKPKPKAKTSAPKVVAGAQRKKRLSSTLSPPRKPVRVTQMLQESHTNGSIGKEGGGDVGKAKMKALPLGKATGLGGESPARKPLSAFSINSTDSPAMPSGIRALKQRAAATKGPSKLGKPTSPIVNMDIIMLDDDGRVLSKERRSSHTGVTANPINELSKPKTTKAAMKSKPKMQVYVDSDSEDDARGQPTQEKLKLKKRRARTIVSDESGTEEDEGDDDYKPIPAPKLVKSGSGGPPPKAKPLGRADTVADVKTQKAQPLKRASTMEVVIPPAPYPTKNVPYLTSLPPVARPSTPPKPRPSIQPRVSAFQRPPSPIFKTRQLTPVRGGRSKGPFEPPSPPSPSYSDLDLSLDFSQLGIDEEELSGASFQESSVPEYLKPLLEECHQEDIGPHDFSSFIESFPYDEILHKAREKAGGDLFFKKIGEASYSEVFGIGNVVLKVIPLRDETPKSGLDAKAKHSLKLAPRGTRTVEDVGTDDGPFTSDAQDVRKEIIVTRAMGEVHRGFVKLLKTYVVKGKYPEALLQLWDDYYEEKGSESIRPDTFTLSQAYAIIVLPNGGPDLEAYTFSNPVKSGWRQACSIFWQVAKSLAHSEHLVSFEHRDLHWGQILVKNVAPVKPRLKDVNVNTGTQSRTHHRVAMDSLEHGVQVTIIDLGLSRMDAGDGSDGDRVQWTPFDDEVFMGEGDYQFDVYRMMREHTQEEWEAYHPLTNVMWLHYLTTKLLRSKNLKAPNATAPKKAKAEAGPAKSADGSGRTEKECYDTLVEVEQWLRQTLVEAFPGQAKATAAAARGKGRGRATMVALPDVPLASRNDGPVCAGEIVEYGTKRGWVRPSRLT